MINLQKYGLTYKYKINKRIEQYCNLAREAANFH